MASQLRRAALSINLNIAEEPAASIETSGQIGERGALIVRIVSMLTKMIG